MHRSFAWLAAAALCIVSVSGPLPGALSQRGGEVDHRGPWLRGRNVSTGPGHERSLFGSLSGWRRVQQDRQQLLSLWYMLEQPLWHHLRRRQWWQSMPSADEAHVGRAVLHARLNQHSTGGAARRVSSAMEATCEAFRGLSISEVAVACPETIVSDVGSSILGFGPVWSVQSASVPSSGLTRGAASFGGVIVVHPKLVEQLTDSELQALLGLHVGRLLLGPATLRAWPLWASWVLVRAFSWAGLRAEGKAILEQLGLTAYGGKRRRFRMVRKWGSRSSTSGSQRRLRAAGKEALVLQGASFVLKSRNLALAHAEDRLAVVAGGSVLAAEGALRKAQDFSCQPLEERLRHMCQWAESSSGRELLLRRNRQSRLSSSIFEAFPLRTVMALALTGVPVVAAIRWLGPGAAVVLLSLALAASALVWVEPLWQFTENQRAVELLILAACLYFVSATIACTCCMQKKTRGGHGTIESLIEEVLPAAAEAAAGAALLARCGTVACQSPLSQLEKDLRTRWATALRGLSAKLADLRRLAGASGHFSAGQSVAASRAGTLCMKLEHEMKRALAAEMVWMKSALEFEQEIALHRALFWWLHEDGEGGTWGSPRLAGTAEHLAGWDEVSALEKLQCPSLATAGVSPDLLRGKPSQAAGLMLHAATALEEQHLRLDHLCTSLRHAVSGKPEPRAGHSAHGWGVLNVLQGLRQAGTRFSRVEAIVLQFLQSSEPDNASISGSSSWGPEAAARAEGIAGHTVSRSVDRGAISKLTAQMPSGQTTGRTVSRCWSIVLFFVLLAMTACSLAFAQAGVAKLWPKAVAFAVVNLVLLWHHWRLRLPRNWAHLERCLATMAARREELAACMCLEGRPLPERLAHLKALVMVQGVRTAQNLDYLTLCVQAEALRNAASVSDASVRGASQRRAAAMGLRAPGVSRVGRPAADSDHGRQSPEDFTYHCLQLLFAVLPRHGRQGQRQVSSDSDIYQAMDWFSQLEGADGRHSAAASVPEAFWPSESLRSLQVALATCQRQLWMMFRLCDVRSMARPSALQGSLAALLAGQIGPIVLEHRLKCSRGAESASPGCYGTGDVPARSGPASDDSGRILGDLDSTTGSNDAGSGDDSSQASGTVRRILAMSEGASSSGSGIKVPKPGAKDADAESCSDGSSCADESVMAGEGEGEGMQRILAASDVSDGASSESASSAGGNSFALQSSMWSGLSRSSASASSLAEDMLTHRRPLLEGYAHALKPLFMTRGDISHLLAKFPPQVLIGGSVVGRSYAAHRELLEELFGSLVVWVKSPERKGKLKLAFGASFQYGEEAYTLGGSSTTLRLVAHGVGRTGNELFPVVYEEDEHEDEDRSECAASAARDDGGNANQGVLEFEELVVTLTEVSSRELFLAELMQSDQCQLLASLSQGTHSKYGHRALRRRRRTLRHVRDAAQLLVNVPTQE